MKLLLAIVGCLAALGCNPTGSPQGPSPVVVIDAGTVTPAMVCGHLAQLGCPEGKAATCAATLQQVVSSRVTDPKLSCLMAAGTVQAVQACGSVGCAAP